MHLTLREYGLLEFLAFNRAVVTRTMIWTTYDENDESTSTWLPHTPFVQIATD